MNESNEWNIVYPVGVSRSTIISRLQVLDELAAAGRILCKKLQIFSFGLEDTFCDVTDLDSALMNIRMPDSAVTFLSRLLNIRKAEFSLNASGDITHDPN